MLPLRLETIYTQLFSFMRGSPDSAEKAKKFECGVRDERTNYLLPEWKITSSRPLRRNETSYSELNSVADCSTLTG